MIVRQSSYQNLKLDKKSEWVSSIAQRSLVNAVECNRIPREAVIPEQTPNSGKAAMSKTHTVNIEPSVPVAQKTRTSSVKLVPSRLADFDMKR